MTVDELIAAMTLEEKTSLTAGAGMWYLPPIERLGIPALKVSDGPSGVRGDSLIGRRSLSLPCGTAIGSTWNTDLVRRLGLVVAAEADSKGVHVVLGPTVCTVRTPLAGRTFESYSEDPHLTARLAVAYISGTQTGRVGCCIKHFACNDQEHERMTISAEVDERTLREMHLPAFAAAVSEAGVWAVMTAYNRVNGIYCGEQPTLIADILRGEWGFDGVVMSDWFGTHSTAPAAEAGLDLEMPGPPVHLGPTLADAVRAGEVDESVLDGQVRHLLTLMERVGILGGGRAGEAPAEREDDDPERRAVARQVATEGTVLLANDGLLPLDPGAVRRVAVIGPNANLLEAGGGSSEVTPLRRRRLYEAIAAVLPEAEVTYETGCRINRAAPTVDMTLLENEGFTVDYFAGEDLGGVPVATETAHAGRVMWIRQMGPKGELEAGHCSVRLRTTFTPDVDGEWTLGLESAGRSVLRLEGDVVVDNSEPTRGTGFYGAGSEVVTAGYELVAGTPYAVEIDLWPRSTKVPILGVRLIAERPTPPDEFERAVAAAAAADVAVVVVGLNGQWESEGFDRPDLSLPGRQRELVEAVAVANPATVVVINGGSAVEMPWVDHVAATLMTWYPGEEGADALADMLVGRSEPSGRLPVSLPTRVEDTSAYGWYPGADGCVTYGEGTFVGYRHHTTSGIAPQFAFGHGLSYTTFEYGEVKVTATRPPATDADAGVSGNGTERNGTGPKGRRKDVEHGMSVWVAVTNTGERTGSDVVQVYVRAVVSRVPRPDRQLVGFTKATIEPGATATVEVPLTESAFSYWDIETHDWRIDPGRYELLIGSSSEAIHATVAADIAVP
jgi:beta-glucosidase